MTLQIYFQFNIAAVGAVHCS